MPDIISNTIQAHVACFNNATKNYEFLVLQRSAGQELYPLLWQVVTGWIEEGESAVRAALREIVEETGLEVTRFWTIPYITSFYNPKQDVIQTSPVFGALVKDKDQLKLSEEHRDYKWLDLESCVKILELPTHIEATKHFMKYILSNENNAIFEVGEWNSI